MNSKAKTDVFGQPIEVGCYVATAHRNDLYVGKVVKITKVMVHVEDTRNKWSGMVYQNNCVRIDGIDVMAYILKG